MPVETLNCPMCGAPSASDSTNCTHCGARLATVACPSCFGLMFLGAKFCSHCGAAAQRTEAAPLPRLNCPHCKDPMQPVQIGKTTLQECAKCEGLWLDGTTLEKLCADREEQAAVAGMAMAVPHPIDSNGMKPVHYLPCPVCAEIMNRINFAHCSGIIVDVCQPHGTWFDRDELQRVVEFIQAGGLARGREQELAQYKSEKSAADASYGSLSGGNDLSMNSESMLESGVRLLGNLLVEFLRK